MRFFCFVLLTFVLTYVLIGCGKNKLTSTKVLQASIIKTIPLPKYNAFLGAGYDTEHLAVLMLRQDTNSAGLKEEIVVYLLDLSNFKSTEVTMSIGKGPGELADYPFSVQLESSNMYFHLPKTNEMRIFSQKGKWIDNVVYSESMNSNTLSEYAVVHEENIYFHNSKNYLLAKMDVNGRVVKSLKYQEKYDLNKKKIRINGGCMVLDKRAEQFYIGYYNLPFRVEVYDLDLNLKDVIRYKVEYFSPYELDMTKRFNNLSGTSIISNIVIDEEYLYLTCFVNSGIEINQDNNYIYVIDKKTKQPIKRINFNSNNTLSNQFDIILATRDFIIGYYYPSKDEKMSNPVFSGDAFCYLLVYENPMYEKGNNR